MNSFRQDLQLGISLASQGKLDEALKALKNALDETLQGGEERKVCLVYKNLGLVYERRGDLRRAKSSYLKALNHCAEDPYLHFSLGALSQQLKQEQAAHRYFTTSHELAERKKEKDLLEMLAKRGYA